MVLTFIGFSGCGKSHLAQLFASELGWKHFCCDSLIEELLGPELDQSEAAGTRRVAHWLGVPSSDGFLSRQSKYLAAEQQVMEEICREISHLGSDEQAIVDTTGSVIYMPQKILDSLRASSTLVYLRIPPADEERMYQQYILDPKPLVWLDAYSQNAGQSLAQALKTSYPVLLHQRAKSYARWAHHVIPAGFADRPTLTPRHVLEQLHSGKTK